jgi:hypothetical protein
MNCYKVAAESWLRDLGRLATVNDPIIRILLKPAAPVGRLYRFRREKPGIEAHPVGDEERAQWRLEQKVAVLP